MKFRRNKPVRWGDICRVMRMFGYIDDFSKADGMRVRHQLVKLIEAGRVEQVTRNGQAIRGLYRMREA